MKKLLFHFVVTLLLVPIGHASSEYVESILCSSSSSEYRKFTTYLYEGNQGTKRYEGDVYGKQTYLLTDKAIHGAKVTEVYTLLYTNVTPSPKQFSLSYSLSDYRENPDSFTIDSNMRDEESYNCRVESN